MKNNNKQIRERIVSQVLELLDKGINPWVKPWSSGGSLGDHNATSGHTYSGINIPVLAYSSST